MRYFLEHYCSSITCMSRSQRWVVNVINENLHAPVPVCGGHLCILQFVSASLSVAAERDVLGCCWCLRGRHSAGRSKGVFSFDRPGSQLLLCWRRCVLCNKRLCFCAKLPWSFQSVWSPQPCPLRHDYLSDRVTHVHGNVRAHTYLSKHLTLYLFCCSACQYHTHLHGAQISPLQWAALPNVTVDWWARRRSTRILLPSFCTVVPFNGCWCH